ncbi:uncharacterized protein LOC106713675 [Papilio machaon]|uniref:uncharacterized protein LOC106713675 n=1 Tax=Papilio machaon TaxID=76193 RepID=UPI001E665442|nr:uncharacterized protein LOC106713675 [Papilio machaon]
MAHKCWETWIKTSIVCLVVILSFTIADFTTECQRPCDCRWQSGNKAAICSNSSLKVVPANLSNDVQILDLSNNNLHQLPQEAFKRVGLSNLKKLFLRDCNIEIVHKAAFLSLAIMIELDMSKNYIRYLHPDTFKGTEKLRLINLNNNYIDKLEEGLFRNLKFLQKVEMSNNRIVRISTKAFINLPQLKILRFDGNNLNHMKPETLSSLRNLSGLDLHNNPWKCDCNLQSFRDWVISHNLYTPPTSCAEPASIRDKLWNELDSSNFACRPTILEPLSYSTIKSYDDNVTLICKVVGNPPPDVTWRFNGKLIEIKNFGEIRYSIVENTMDLIRWLNLTIIHTRYSDRGNYTCVAENPGGRDEKTTILLLSKYAGAGTIAGMDIDSFAILIGCITAIVIIFGAVIAVCLLTSQNAEMKRLIKNDTRSSNGEALIEGSVTSEPEKGLKSEVNPIIKPARKFEEAPSLTSDATEMSELNKTLLENDSVLASYEENINRRHQVDIPKISKEILLDRLAQEHQAYPPDLLSFPLRNNNQVSPSSFTLTQEKSSINQKHIRSPIKSPNFETDFNPIKYNTLQTNNSNQGTIPLINPKGYVTLPRRPRMSYPDSRQAFTNLNGVIPYYDSFNMKLFGNGGNYYSLNKSEIDLGPVSKYCMQDDPDESEPAPSPAPGTPHATIPRNSLSSPNINNQLQSLQAMSRTKQKPLKVTLAENDSFLKNPIKDRATYSVNVVSESLGRTKSVPNQTIQSKKIHSTEIKEILNAVENATQV